VGETTKYKFPWPELTDPANGPQDIKDLAIAVDTVLASIVASASTPGILRYRSAAFNFAVSGGIIPINVDRSLFTYGTWTLNTYGHPIVPVSGRYILNAQLVFAPRVEGNRCLSICINGAAVGGASDLKQGIASNSTPLAVSVVRNLKVGDNVGLYGWQSSTTPLSCGTAILSVNLLAAD
jgi:hypothetical protein